MPWEYIYNGGTTGVCELCKQLLRLEIGTLADWEESQHTPLKFLHLTLRHWMDKSAAPYSVGNSFGLELFLHNWIDECDHRSCRQLRAAPQRRVAQLGIELLQRKSANDLVSQQP